MDTSLIGMALEWGSIIALEIISFYSTTHPVLRGISFLMIIGTLGGFGVVVTRGQ